MKTTGFFQYLDGVTVYGGVLDALGTSLWDCKKSGKNCPSGTTFLLLLIALTPMGFTYNHYLTDQSVSLTLELELAMIVSPSRPGHSGLRVGFGSGSTNVSIQGIQCGPGHGISIGSLGIAEDEQGVEDVTVSNVEFTATSNGVRIKTWERNSKSFAKNIVFQHIKMKMVKNPIIIDQHYCFVKPCPNQESGVEVSNVRYEDIDGTSSSTDVAVKLDCSKEKPCTGIVMDNVNLALQLVNRPAQASCNNANGLANDVVIPFTPCLKRDTLMT
ncbi:hypothetical protein N665_0212s0045 [Sinapis alba]|nr:hypothetical protein N665_0212s0045 [Sinapis alba]